MPGTPTWSNRLFSRMMRTRWLVRAPIGMYRARLGILFGHRMLLLEHRGRTSGLWRQVVLEVAERDAGGYLVAAGLGERTQWLRNVAADPRVRVSIAGRRNLPAIARRLDPEEAGEALARYRSAHPTAWDRLSPILRDTVGEPIEGPTTRVPVVRLDLAAAPPAAG